MSKFFFAVFFFKIKGGKRRVKIDSGCCKESKGVGLNADQRRLTESDRSRLEDGAPGPQGVMIVWVKLWSLG